MSSAKINPGDFHILARLYQIFSRFWKTYRDDISSAQDGIRAWINEDCARRYRDRKNELKRHFNNYGGYDNVENAKNHPPDTQTQEAWEKIIDELFLNADFMKQSVKNASNRSKQLYAIAGERRSYAQMRHEDERLEEKAARMHKESRTEQIDEEECLSRVLGDRRG
ncbi:hypothetical protein R6Q59_014913 [Mikania micrantha]